MTERRADTGNKIKSGIVQGVFIFIITSLVVGMVSAGKKLAYDGAVLAYEAKELAVENGNKIKLEKIERKNLHEKLDGFISRQSKVNEETVETLSDIREYIWTHPNNNTSTRTGD